MTNSHCTNVAGGEETPTDYYQNRQSNDAPDFIGTELDDPHWTSSLNLDCPPPLACRYNDAALVAYAPGVLLGILWGGSTDGNVAEWAHSPLSGIEREIGPLKTY